MSCVSTEGSLGEAVKVAIQEGYLRPTYSTYCTLRGSRVLGLPGASPASVLGTKLKGLVARQRGCGYS